MRRGRRWYPAPTATLRATSSRRTPTPHRSNAACGQRSPPHRTNPPRRPGWALPSRIPTGRCLRRKWTKCSSTSTRAWYSTSPPPWRGWPCRIKTPKGGKQFQAANLRYNALAACAPAAYQASAAQHGFHSEAAFCLAEALRGASPGLRPTTQDQLQEELQQQATALEEDIRHLRALLAANRKRATKDFWRRNARENSATIAVGLGGRPSWKGGRCSASRTRTPTTGSPGPWAAPSPTGATAGATRQRHSPSPHTSGGAGDGPDGRRERGGGGELGPLTHAPPRYGVTGQRAPAPAGGRAETTSAGGSLLPRSLLTADR